MSGNISTSQLEHLGALDQITSQGASATTLSSLFTSINNLLTEPLSLKAANPVSRQVFIGAITVTNPENGRKTVPNSINGVIPAFAGGSITLPASSGGAITASGLTLSAAYNLTVSSGNYIKLLLEVDAAGELQILFGTEGASEAAATLPPSSSGTITVGYLVAQNVGGTIQNIAEGNIYKYSTVTGGAAGASTGIVPLGGIIAVTTGLAGAFSVPVSGAVSDGWQRADGAVIPGGNAVTGSTPNLTSSVYLRGASTYGTTGGSNTKTLTTTELPAHTHTINHTHTDSFATAGHTHNMQHTHQVFSLYDFDGGAGGDAIAGSSYVSASTGYSGGTFSGNSFGTYEGWIVNNYSASGATIQGLNPVNLLAHIYYTSTNQVFSSRPLDSGGSAKDNTGSASASASMSAFSGSSGSQGSGSSFSIEPNYINVIYLIRVN
jgi:hypothetical protein